MKWDATDPKEESNCYRDWSRISRQGFFLKNLTILKNITTDPYACEKTKKCMTKKKPKKTRATWKIWHGKLEKYNTKFCLGFFLLIRGISALCWVLYYSYIGRPKALKPPLFCPPHVLFGEWKKSYILIRNWAFLLYLGKVQVRL